MNSRSPKPLPIFTADEMGRFSTFIDKSGGLNACWPWTGAADPYGKFKCRGKVYLANRVAYSIENDDQLLDGELVRHTCDNPPCCNPGHLVTGTYLDNVADMFDRDRANPAHGIGHGMAAANDNLIRDILASPLPGRQAAEHFGVSYGLVANARAGRTWNHIDSLENAA